MAPTRNLVAGGILLCVVFSCILEAKAQSGSTNITAPNRNGTTNSTGIGLNTTNTVPNGNVTTNSTDIEWNTTITAPNENVTTNSTDIEWNTTNGDVTTNSTDIEWNTTNGDVTTNSTDIEWNTTNGDVTTNSTDIEWNTTNGDVTTNSTDIEWNTTNGNVTTNSTDIEWNTTNAVSNENGTTQSTHIGGHTTNTVPSGTPTDGTQDKTKTDGPGSEPKDPLDILNEELVNIIQSLSGTIPGLKGLIMNGDRQSQLKSIEDVFLKLLMNNNGTQPEDISNILKSLQSSGLLNFVKGLVGNLQNPGGSSYDWAKCKNDLGLVFTGIQNRQQWVLPMLDASAKPPSGIKRGHLRFMGNYEQCQKFSHKDPAGSRIDGNMCSVNMFIKIPMTGAGIVNLVMPFPHIQWDLCLPKSCRDSDLNAALYQSGVNKLSVACTKDLDISGDRAAIAAIVVLVLFGLLLVAGTITELCLPRKNHQEDEHVSNNRHASNNGHVINGHVNNGHVINAHVNNGQTFVNKGFEHTDVNSLIEDDGKPAMVEISATDFEKCSPEANANGAPIIDRQENRLEETTHNAVDKGKETADKSQTAHIPKWQRALLAFSIPRNTEKILSVKSAPGAIGCLHGIRVLSLAWVIIGHVMISLGQFENPKAIGDRFNTIGFQIILNATLSVDTFFVMSGFLTCYLFLKTVGKKSKVTAKEMVLYYVHRYWRLTPPLIIWIMIVACLMQYVGEGRPGWSDYPFAERCRDNWWNNILYINNVYNKGAESCLGVTWFLANDMQFYIVAPLAMIPWVYGKTILGFAVAFCYVGIQVASTIWLGVKYNSSITHNTGDYFDKIYYSPYTRVAPFAIGLMLGWILWKTKSKIRMNKCLVFLGWTLCIGMILTLSFVSHDENRDIKSKSWKKPARIVYETLYRPLWSLAVSWLIFACATGYGGYINSILSWNGWLPLSRLTYSTFLIHLTILSYESMAPEYTMLFTLTSVSYHFIGTFVMAYSVAYLLTVAVESPMLGLEKFLLHGK